MQAMFLLNYKKMFTCKNVRFWLRKNETEFAVVPAVFCISSLHPISQRWFFLQTFDFVSRLKYSWNISVSVFYFCTACIHLWQKSAATYLFKSSLSPPSLSLLLWWSLSSISSTTAVSSRISDIIYVFIIASVSSSMCCHYWHKEQSLPPVPVIFIGNINYRSSVGTQANIAYASAKWHQRQREMALRI